MTISNFRASAHTLAIFPRWTEYGELYAEVYEMQGMIKATQKPLSIVEDLLAFNGQSMRGAKDGSAQLLGNKKQCAPIVINEVHGMYMLMTGPVNKPETAYIFLKAVKAHYENPSGGTDVLLINGEVISLDMDVKQFSKRLADAALLQFKREQRTALMGRFYQYCAEHREDYGDKLKKKKD